MVAGAGGTWYLVTTVSKVLEVKEGEGLFVVLECFVKEQGAC